MHKLEVQEVIVIALETFKYRADIADLFAQPKNSSLDTAHSANLDWVWC